MGGLKKHLPVTYWTFLIASLAIAGVPALAGFFSKDEILFDTFRHGHTALWVVGVLTSLMTATYMFRLVFLTFHGEERFNPATVGAHGHGGGHGHDDHGHHAAHAGHDAHGHDSHGHGGHLHDAPPAMALALIVLAIGSVAAGYIGVPHALGGHNNLGEWLKPVFALENTQQVPMVSLNAHAGHTAPVEGPLAGEAHGATEAHAADAAHGEAGAEAHDETALELTLMGVSSAIAFLGIGLAAFLWIRNRHIPEQMAQSFSGVHRLLLNKYYVDEVYDAAIVQPIKAFSIHGLWKVADARVIDGAVNGAGALVNAAASALRQLQTGSVKTYAAGTFLGAVLLLAFFLWR